MPKYPLMRVLSALQRVHATPNGCWTFAGELSRGYAPGSLHRVVYEAFFGEVGKDLELDHLCRNRACLNPMHLEPVSCSENTRRSFQARLGNFCQNGHEKTADNIRVRIDSNTGRPVTYCLQCRRDKGERQRAKKGIRKRVVGPHKRQWSDEDRDKHSQRLLAYHAKKRAAEIFSVGKERAS